jgi:hypothetical protein
VAAEIRYPERTGEIYLVRHAARHQWAYFPGMDRHEALIFKQYDSQINGTARFTPHSAFDLLMFRPTPRSGRASKCVVWLFSSEGARHEPIPCAPAPLIEFWFEFGSNYSYPSVMRIEAAAARLGVRVA